MGGKDEAVGVDEGNRELTTQFSRFSFHFHKMVGKMKILIQKIEACTRLRLRYKFSVGLFQSDLCVTDICCIDLFDHFVCFVKGNRD